jgi:hypothetical protein
MTGVATIAVLSVLGFRPATAFDTAALGQIGTLLTSKTVPLSERSRRLREEVKQALAEGNLDSVMCTGMRFPGNWKHLAGERVAPYTCNFGIKWLQIRADVKVTDRSGRVFEIITPKAMRNASRVRETNVRWIWTAENPDEQSSPSR